MIAKIIIFFYVLLFSQHIFAIDKPLFSYNYELTQFKKFNFDLMVLTHYFEERNLVRSTQFPTGHLKFIHADEVMTSPNHIGLVFIKTGLIAPKDYQNTLIQMTDRNTQESFFIFNTTESSIALYNFNKSEAEYLVRDLKPNLTSRIIQLLIPSAHAETTPCLAKSAQIETPLDKTAQDIEQTQFFKKVGECAMTSLSAGTQSVKDTYNFFKTAITDPAQLWSDIKKSFDQLQYFVTHLKAELKNAYEMFQGLKTDEKIDLGCTLAGEAVVSLAIYIGTGRAISGISSLLSTIPIRIERMKVLSDILKKNSLDVKLAKEALSCEI